MRGGNFCPNQVVTRAQMAVFLLKAKHGSAYKPPAASGTVFGDVQISTWGAAWIEQLYADGITGGCGGGNYCPNQVVTRAQMAVFLLRAKHGSTYTPPAASVGRVETSIAFSRLAGNNVPAEVGPGTPPTSPASGRKR